MIPQNLHLAADWVLHLFVVVFLPLLMLMVLIMGFQIILEQWRKKP